MHAKSLVLSIDRCNKHGYYAVSICDKNSGLRVTPSKCCGSWSSVKDFRMSERDWRDLSAKAAEAADALAAQPGGRSDD